MSGTIATCKEYTYHMTAQDTEYLKSRAVNGIISANDYIDAMQHISDTGSGRRDESEHEYIIINRE